MDTLFFHPKVVHVSIALGVLMPLFSGAVLVAWWRQWLPARSWVLVVLLQSVLLASGIVALQTGESEEERVERVVPENAIEAHEEAAEVFLWASGGVLGLMLLALAVSRSRAGLPAATVATLGTLVVLAAGYRAGKAGGDLVYRYNAASVYAGDSDVELAQVPGHVSNRVAEDADEDDDD